VFEFSTFAAQFGLPGQDNRVHNPPTERVPMGNVRPRLRPRRGAQRLPRGQYAGGQLHELPSNSLSPLPQPRRL
jgi:hypothetical protein